MNNMYNKYRPIDHMENNIVKLTTTYTSKSQQAKTQPKPKPREQSRILDMTSSSNEIIDRLLKPKEVMMPTDYICIVTWL